MSSGTGALSVTKGLISQIDFNNIKSFPFRPSTTDHGISDWYCFISGTATYSTTEPNTTIYQVTATNVTTVVITNTLPSRGTFAVTANCRYYANKPMFLVCEDAQNFIAPISMASKLFIHYANRGTYEAGTFYFMHHIQMPQYLYFIIPVHQELQLLL